MQGKFELELSEFSFVTGVSGRMLRCTLGLIFTDEETKEKVGMSLKGCFATRSRKTGEIMFSTPMTYMNRGTVRMKLAAVTPALYKTVIKMLNESKYAKYIGETLEGWDKKIEPKRLDKDLPEALAMDKPETTYEDEVLEGWD